MRQHIIRFATITIVVLQLTANAAAQVSAGLVAQILQAHVSGGVLPTDLTVLGEINDGTTTRPLRLEIKGTDKVRVEVGRGQEIVLSIVNGRSGWEGSLARLKPLPEHAIQHPGEIPFLDVIAEVGNPRLKVTDQKLERVGTATLRHVALRLSDPTPNGRPFNRAIHEDVDLFVDPATNLVVRSQHILTAENSLDFRVPLVRDFSDYRVVSGLAVPFRIAVTVGTAGSGIYRYTWTLQSVAVNQGIPNSAFQPTKEQLQ